MSPTLTESFERAKSQIGVVDAEISGLLDEEVAQARTARPHADRGPQPGAVVDCRRWIVRRGPPPGSR